MNNKTKSFKKLVGTFTLLLLVGCMLTGCGHEHTWVNATCSEPKKCSECGETEGSPLGHDWFEATCTEAKKCSRCGAVNGVPLGHEWLDATCTEAKKCSRCGTTEGEALGHEWLDATCTEAKKCSRCGATEGEALGHEWLDATCTEAKKCNRCGAIEGRPLGHNAEVTCTESAVCSICGEEVQALGHDWEEATCKEPKTCKRCGETEGEALGHDPGEPSVDILKAATCTEDGESIEIIICKRCYAPLKNETTKIPAYGHTTDNGVCERCGIEIFKKVSKSGDDVVSKVEVGSGLYRVHFINSGKRNFVVWVHDYYGDRDLAVNEIGNYDGYYFLSGESPFMFEVESDGKWSYQIERVGYTDSLSFSGKGDYVTDMFSASTGTWHITHDGKSNFAIWAYTTDGRDLLVNEIGKYNGRKVIRVPSGSNVMLEITADGKWSITPDED